MIVTNIGNFTINLCTDPESGTIPNMFYDDYLPEDHYQKHLKDAYEKSSFEVRSSIDNIVDHLVVYENINLIVKSSNKGKIVTSLIFFLCKKKLKN